MRFERWLYSAPLKWRSLFQRRDADRDLDDEIRYHLETEVEGLVSRGMGRDEAWRVVRRRFGGIDQATEQCRDARGLNTIDALAQDTRFAARMLRRHPGFTIVAVLTLALGIGANTAVFSLVDGILLARLPYPDSKRLVSVTGTYPNGAFAALRDESRTMDVAAYTEGKWLRLKAGGAPIRVSATRVSAELFAILDAKPALGRTLRPGEDEALRDRYAILSHELWATRFARDEQIVGRFIDLDGVRREVVAVMPATFRFPRPARSYGCRSGSILLIRAPIGRETSCPWLAACAPAPRWRRGMPRSVHSKPGSDTLPVADAR